MKKPAKTIIPVGWATIRGSGAAQPGNRPGRGKAAHKKPAAKKPAPKGGMPKIAPGWFHPAVQAATAKKKTAAKKAKKHPRRQLALGEGVACCSAEALAASLRLAGVPVSDGDVLALYWRTAADADAGASILATLEAAARFGLAGVRPAEIHELKVQGSGPSFARWRAIRDSRHIQHAGELDALHLGQLNGLDDVAVALLDRHEPAAAVRFNGHGGDVGRGDTASVLVHGLILGLDLPGSHAVLATADGWWSWGELYDPAAFPDAVIEEAWEVTWPDTR